MNEDTDATQSMNDVQQHIIGQTESWLTKQKTIQNN